MSANFILCVRDVRKGSFILEPGPARYLQVPKGEIPLPKHTVPRGRWIGELSEAATWGTDDRRGGGARGDLLVFVHGYNNTACRKSSSATNGWNKTCGTWATRVPL